MSTDPFDVLTDRLFDEIWNKPKSPIPPTVYHYTDAGGLHGILSSKRIWATDYRFLNDESESLIGKAIALEIVRPKSINSKEEYLRQFYRFLRQYLVEDGSSPNFVFSLSSRKDDLTQWRTYAQDGRGFTVGFNTNSLIENSKNADNFGFAKILYGSKVHDSSVRRAISLIEELLSKNVAESVDEMICEHAALMAEWIITSNSALFKHSSFQSEREWRINTYFNQGDEVPIRVRASNGKLIPYMELKLCTDEENCLPITHIGIGPGFKHQEIRFAVEKLCEQTGYSVNIYNADTPFRRL